MPIYEYHCSHCEADFELLVMGSDQPECPDCHQTDIEKQLSVPASPAVKSGDLPIAPSRQESCGLPRCCGGGCQP